MISSNSSQSVAAPLYFWAILSLVLMGTPVVLAHGGHGDEFRRRRSYFATGSIQVDAETAKRLGIKVEPVNKTGCWYQNHRTLELCPAKSRGDCTDSRHSGWTVGRTWCICKGSTRRSFIQPWLSWTAVESQENEQRRKPICSKLKDLKLAQQNLERQRQIAADIEQTRTELKVAQSSMTAIAIW